MVHCALIRCYLQLTKCKLTADPLWIYFELYLSAGFSSGWPLWGADNNLSLCPERSVAIYPLRQFPYLNTSNAPRDVLIALVALSLFIEISSIRIKATVGGDWLRKHPAPVFCIWICDQTPGKPVISTQKKLPKLMWS